MSNVGEDFNENFSSNVTEVHSGHFFDFENPSPEDIKIEDIAHSLSKLCRFNGHTVRFYSVAEHSVLASRIVDEEHQLWALLHDAAEAYIGDMNANLKQMIGGRYLELESEIEHCVAQRFDLPTPEIPEEVRKADLQMLKKEKRIVVESDNTWPVFQERDVAVPPIHVKFWTPTLAKMNFLRRFEELAD